MSTISIIAAIADKSAIGKNQQLSPCSATAQSEECRIDDYARGWFRELFRLRVYGGRSGFM